MNKVVARYADGRIVKGTAADFSQTKAVFHLTEIDAPPETRPVEINVNDLKAIIFVKDFVGDPNRVHCNDFDPTRPPAGRRIRVLFNDGEVLVGTTTGYQPGRRGFFLEPADVACNVVRCYVVAAATSEIRFI